MPARYLATGSIRRGASLVQFRKSHGHPHGVLQVLLRTTFHTCFLLLIQRFATKTLNAMTEAPFHQRIVHLQAAFFIHVHMIATAFQSDEQPSL